MLEHTSPLDLAYRMNGTNEKSEDNRGGWRSEGGERRERRETVGHVSNGARGAAVL